MPLQKIGREYFTPGGCSAWNGRAIDAAAIDSLCNLTFLHFVRGGWYYATEIPFFDFLTALDGREDIGCWFNLNHTAETRKLWKPLNEPDLTQHILTNVWNPQTFRWDFIASRSIDEIFAGCKSRLIPSP